MMKGKGDCILVTGGVGAEILLSEIPEEVVDILRALGAAARSRILAAHTAEHRAEELEAYVTEAVTA